MIVRPVMRSLTTVSVRPAAAGGALVSSPAIASPSVARPAEHRAAVAAARNLVGQDPKRARPS